MIFVPCFCIHVCVEASIRVAKIKNTRRKKLRSYFVFIRNDFTNLHRSNVTIECFFLPFLLLSESQSSPLSRRHIPHDNKSRTIFSVFSIPCIVALISCGAFACWAAVCHYVLYLFGRCGTLDNNARLDTDWIRYDRNHLNSLNLARR